MLTPGAYARPARDPYWLSLEVCREFIRNKCNRTEDECKFAHPPPQVEVQNGKVTCCFDSLQGRCIRTEPPCKYFHPPPHLREQLAHNRRQVSQSLPTSSLGPGMQAVLPGVLPLANPYLLQNVGTFSPYAAAGLSSQHGYATRLDTIGASVSSPAAAAAASPQMAWMMQTAAFGTRSQRSDRIEVCREYQRGICTRSPNECRYAHPPENITTDAENHVTVCMDFLKGRCTRELCRYFHPPPHLQSQIKSQHRTSASHAMDPASLPTSSALPSWQMLSNIQPSFAQQPQQQPPSAVAVSSYQQLAALAALQQQQQQQQQQQLFQNLSLPGPPHFPPSDVPRF